MGITYDVLVVRYSELFLKNAYVKKKFRDILISNIAGKLKQIGSDYQKIKVEDDLICIYGDIKDEILINLANTFGVSSVSPALRCKPNISSIKENFNKVKDAFLIKSPNSFCIRAKKDKQLKISHKTIEIELASLLKGIKVDLKNAELKIYVDANRSSAFIYWEKIRGIGGLPYGSQGKVVALISNGIDSPVSTWLLCKRGCEVIALYFGNNKPTNIINILANFAGRSIKLISIPYFGEFLKQLRENNAGKYMCILCKSGMYRVANEVAKRYGAKAIVTGENLGQVASQTLANLRILDNLSELPVLRPLIGLNKEEIIEMARKIGSFNLQINNKCEFVPEKPATEIAPDSFKKLLEIVHFEEELEKLLKIVNTQ